MNSHSIERLRHVHPLLSYKVQHLVLQSVGTDIEVVQGLRTFAEQDALFAIGRTKPGHIVTNARGGQSNHNYGLAVDLCPFVNGIPQWDADASFDLIGKRAVSLGLEWGGAWQHLVDNPHVQLPGISVKLCQQLYGSGIDKIWRLFPVPFSGLKFAGELKVGDENADVYAVQKKLDYLGWNLKADLQFGPATAAALKLFQAKAKLPETGVVDMTTWNLLMNWT